MSTRQYIGARYVPRFVGVYDPTQAYDALDVVDNGSGTTYIARIQTPPNTPLTDTTHWLVYGSSSGAILDLQSRVSNIETDIPVIKSSILSIGGQIDDIDDDITQLQNDLDDLNDIVDLTKHKRFVIIADSFGQLPGNNTFIDKLKSWYNVSDADFFKTAEGGAGYSVAGNSGHTFTQLVENLTVTNPDTITHVVIMGGINDTYEGNTQSDFLTGIRSTLNAVRTRFANAKIYACYNCGFIYGFSLTRRALKQAYRTAFLECITSENMVPVDVSTLSQIGGFISFSGSDYIHPTNTGAVLLAFAIHNAIENGNPLHIKGTYTDTTFGIQFVSDGDISKYVIPSNTTFNFSPSVRIGTTAVSVGSMQDIPLMTCPAATVRIPLASITYGSTTGFVSDIQLHISNDGTISLSSPGTGYSDVSKVIIYAYSLEHRLSAYLDV